MKLIKERKAKGYVISVLIGNWGQNSWWTSPPIYGVDNHSCNFEKEYLINRYPKINTKKRAETFSRLYKNLWIDISEKQFDLMKHCLGLDYKKKPYRNYFCTDPNDEEWNRLVNKGLAIKAYETNDGNTIYFWLNQQGIEYVLGKSISEKVYKKL